MKRTVAIVTKVIVSLGFTLAVGVMLLWLAGFFQPKIDTSRPVRVEHRRVPEGAQVVPVEVVQVPRSESAVGTVEADRQATIASRILSRVVSLDVEAGARVKAGQILATLDDSDLRQRLEQTQAVLDASRASLDQAGEELARAERSAEQGAASELEVIRARNAVRAADANVQRAERSVAEGQTVLDHAIIRAPFDGVVIERQAEVGDTATPGMPLLTMYDPSRMQLVAGVRESLAVRLAVGDYVKAEIESLDLVCEAEVTEIVPEASARSRSFRVKVSGPCPPGVYPGMFGRISIPLEQASVLAVPAQAIHRVGQLDFVDLASGLGPDATLTRRSVQIGRTLDDGLVEVLAGLRQGELVLVSNPESAS
ncbi:MAG: efflux RND transporter periplasmic adaptor subunit [Leptolyngbya sp. PLA3]|nr:MAG: efflux RND transporter periplasmic adaptor subunit [Cyanobacteria bacterium CYA]MCE7969365.1 efflux RND transporter periplasmic adaptor subunit [Leptolyngbya sp. PL-A3]